MCKPPAAETKKTVLLKQDGLKLQATVEGLEPSTLRAET